ncbi:MAG: type II toxin-antitoxin system VapC family toxin [Nocardioidaceae bacterium]|nr:type II toxin-antitoxin system VapC family toxin [Nocardioidaceae bacterium]
MIVDSSALVAIVREESDASVFLAALRTAERPPRIAAPTLVETSVVVDGSRVRAGRRLDELVFEANLEVVPFDEEMARIARAAYRDFGRGSGHPANLNLGDCFSYALAVVTGEPLLYKGDDFSRTDVRSASPEVQS